MYILYIPLSLRRCQNLKLSRARKKQKQQISHCVRFVLSMLLIELRKKNFCIERNAKHKRRRTLTGGVTLERGVGAVETSAEAEVGVEFCF